MRRSRVCWLSSWLVLPVVRVSAWTTTTPRHGIGSLLKSAASEDDGGWFRCSDPANNNHDSIGPEPSRMPEHVMDFLKNSNRKSEAEQPQPQPQPAPADYLIAIPVDTCHELMLELESIQRGILYHCPLLVHSCIPAAATRLPLLYVTVPWNSSSTTTTSAEQLDTLHDVVYAAVEQHIGGVAPTLQFQGLEMDRGPLSSNQVLLAVAPESSGESCRNLQRLVQELQHALDTLGWITRVPYSGDDDDDDDKDVPTSALRKFRPRIPFMRLPDNWNWYLEQQQQQKLKQFTNANNTTTSTSTTSSSDAAETTSSDCFLTADEGGNGISPIHWGKWADDVLGGPQRLSQVALYPRRRSQLSSLTTSALSLEQVFPWPALSVALPNGTEAQIRAEAAFAAYQERRWADAEAALQSQRREGDGDNNNKYKRSDDSTSTRPSQDDLLLSMTRQKLERLYETETATPTDLAKPGGSNDIHNDENKNGLVVLDWDDIQSELATPPQRPSDPSAVEDWTRRRIEQAVMSRARVQSERELARKKNKPPIADNVIFAKYKDGSLVPPEQRQNDTETSSNSFVSLPPFPSAQHCIGFWRMVSSPTGFAVEQDGAGDSSRSDNLILRVDGTIAGGPILDPETRQKASGGTWTLQLLDQDEASSSTTATLRINLLIPPQKERVLVMMGRLVMEDDDDKLARLPSPQAPVSLPTLTSNTFGIPILEARAASAAAADEALSDKNDTKGKKPRQRIACQGSVWLEDADTGRNRDDIGSFAIVKLDTPADPRQFTITIPRNVRNQD